MFRLLIIVISTFQQCLIWEEMLTFFQQTYTYLRVKNSYCVVLYSHKKPTINYETLHSVRTLHLIQYIQAL